MPHRSSRSRTSNKIFSEWGQVFGDEVLATAILDRLLHHCEVISINGPSYRATRRSAGHFAATHRYVRTVETDKPTSSAKNLSAS